MFKIILAAVLVPALVRPDSVPFRPCPNGAPTPASLEIQGCSALPCIMRRNQSINVEARGIVSPVSTNNVEAFINVFLAGLDLGFPIPSEIADACVAGIQSCPLVEGQPFDYTFNSPITEVPIVGVPVEIRVGLRDGATPIECAVFDGRFSLF